MDYNLFKQIFNETIFEKSKADLLEKISNSPSRYIGLFRPTKPKAKILQNLLQSHEIRFGDAFEHVIEKYLQIKGCEILQKRFTNSDGDVLNIDENKILISSVAREGLTPILARIQHTEKCIDEGLDLKYGAIMEGQYGTGKTLLAFMIGKIAIRHGWTFIYLKDCRYIAKTLKIAENYAKTDRGCIVFAEDIDQTIRGERDSHMQEILNIIDGGDAKQKPIISIFTTNHIELIEPTFIR